ncbi:hypothetical protein GF345_04580 [Candidatus Woesearchaeota archaeon]|nr:hypothetical protein [Candidatus Woesearchaeota archaeon]
MKHKASNQEKQNPGYLSRIFTANGFKDHSEQIMPSLNGSAHYLKSLGHLEFLMEKAEQMAYSAGKPDTARGILSHFDFNHDDLMKWYPSHQSDLRNISLNRKMVDSGESGKPRYVTLADVATALVKNLEYRRHMIQESLSAYDSQPRQMPGNKVQYAGIP